MGAFSKSVRVPAPDYGCVPPTVEVPVTTTIRSKDGSISQVVELKRKSVEDYAKSLGLPDAADYQLRAMLAAGIMPQEVNVVGILDSQDPTDIRNVGATDALLDRLEQSAPVENPAPAQSVVEPTNE